MKKLIALALLLSSGVANAANIEPNAKIGSEFNPGVLDAMVNVIRANGYKCSSINWARAYMSSGSLGMRCDHGKSAYFFEKKNGKIFVEKLED